MRVALINLPHPVPVVRRYMCSYNSPIFLFPPLELLYAATSVRQLAGAEVIVIDAIADRLSKETTLDRLREFRPDLVLTITGFEIFEDDVRLCRWLRDALPEVKFAAFGHYPTTFPRETLEAARFDYVLRGEPEYTLVELCRALSEGQPPTAILGLSYRDEDGNVVNNPDRARTRHVDELPHPDYALVDPRHYSEFLLPRPFAIVQTARGCPYTCNFCVRSYGQKLGMRTPDNIIEELTQLRQRFRIRSFRFIDDTFTAIPSRTIEICEKITRHVPGVVWSCLSRIDTLDEDRVRVMRRAGCRRVYMGIESGSRRILQAYGKDYGVELVGDMVSLLHRYKIEVGAFFMVGHPEETEADFEQTSRLIRSLDLDYATIGQTVPYPGTTLFEQHRDEIEFSLFPYRNEWKSPQRREQLESWERRFYRDIYFSLPYVARHAARFFKHPATTMAAGKALLPFIFGSNQSVGTRNELV